MSDFELSAGPGTVEKKVMVLGVGNILLRDEGVGVRVIERLKASYEFPPEVELMDGGTAGLDLMPFMEGYKHVIIVDTLKTTEPPGSIFRFTPEDIDIKVPYKTSLHQIGMVEVFAIAEALGKKIEAVIIGIQPEDMSDWGLELTQTIEAKIPELMELVLKELKALGIAPITH